MPAVGVVLSSSLPFVHADSIGFGTSFHHHEPRSASASFLFLPKSATQTYRCGLRIQQHHQKIISLMNNNPSWNIIPRGVQQSPHSPKTYSTSLFDGSSILSAATSSPFLQYNIVIFLVNLLGMMISLVFPGMQYHLDLLGTGSFAIASSYMLLINGVNSSLLRVQVSSIAVIIWATKLAAFLFYRALSVKEDARLESTLSTKSGVVFFWLVSFFWGVISSLPHSLGIGSSLDAGDNNIIGLYSGTIIYTVGLLMESIADYQKWTWKQSNPGKFCRTGLWSISQHPNFAGNILIWTGITIMNLPSLAWQLVPIACLSPLILWNFFLGQAQGSITSGVELATKKYGGYPDYNDYIENVPLLFPNLKRLFAKET
jgi:steroid 5-alpha reductase family enzyme